MFNHIPGFSEGLGTSDTPVSEDALDWNATPDDVDMPLEETGDSEQGDGSSEGLEDGEYELLDVGGLQEQFSPIQITWDSNGSPEDDENTRGHMKYHGENEGPFKSSAANTQGAPISRTTRVWSRDDNDDEYKDDNDGENPGENPDRNPGSNADTKPETDPGTNPGTNLGGEVQPPRDGSFMV